MVARCTFLLNGEAMSTLTCAGSVVIEERSDTVLAGGTFSAFSGTDALKNLPRATANADNGPIPKGDYYIVDRESGGRLGALREIIKDTFAGTRRRDWFGLYRNDGTIDDTTSVEGIVRGAFRLHPVGYWGISEGCVTLPSVSDFETIRRFLKAQPTGSINGIRYYGILTVR